MEDVDRAPLAFPTASPSSVYAVGSTSRNGTATLQDRGAGERFKAFWEERLGLLAELVAAG